MNLFKRKQLSRVIESIGRAANYLDTEVKQTIDEYTSYDNYEKALKDLTYTLYERFYIEDKVLCNYSLDMIKNIGFNYFSSQDEMIKYASKRLNKKINKTNANLKIKHNNKKSLKENKEL